MQRAAQVTKLQASKVRELDLSMNDIGPEGAKAVEAMAAVVASLTSLSTAYNDISGNGGGAAAGGCGAVEAHTLEVFSGILLKELRADSLTTLDLFDKGLGVPEAMVLADLLRSVSASPST